MTAPNEKGKNFPGKWSRLEWFTDRENILDPAERARLYDKLKRQGLLNHRRKQHRKREE